MQPTGVPVCLCVHLPWETGRVVEFSHSECSHTVECLNCASALGVCVAVAAGPAGRASNRPTLFLCHPVEMCAEHNFIRPEPFGVLLCACVSPLLEDDELPSATSSTGCPSCLRTCPCIAMEEVEREATESFAALAQSLRTDRSKPFAFAVEVGAPALLSAAPFLKVVLEARLVGFQGRCSKAKMARLFFHADASVHGSLSNTLTDKEASTWALACGGVLNDAYTTLRHAWRQQPASSRHPTIQELKDLLTRLSEEPSSSKDCLDEPETQATASVLEC